MIAEIIARLRDSSGQTGLKQVDGAAQFQAIVESQRNPAATPAAYVIPARESAPPSSIYSRVRQKVSSGVVIVLVVKNVADAKGEAAGIDMEALRAAVDAALLGWAPTADHEPFQFEGGALAAFKDGHMWWQDAYRTQFTKSNA